MGLIWEPICFNQADAVCIQSLEEQLKNAAQQLTQLRVGHSLSATKGQLAVQQSEANEQLDALRAECNLLLAATKKAVVDCDNSRKGHLQLQATACSATKNGALREQCTNVEAEVDRLRKENAILKQMRAKQSKSLDEKALAAQEQDDAMTPSVALGPLSFPTLSGI